MKLMDTLASRFDELKAGLRLPSPPEFAAEIMRVSGNTGASIDKWAELASSDPASALRVIKLANSNWTGRPTASITEASRRLGVERARQACLDFSVGEQARCVSTAFDFARYWSMSYARAVAARELADRFEVLSPDEAFGCGMIAGVGELVLATIYPREYTELSVEKATRNDDGDRLVAERTQFGITSVQLSAALLRDCGVPSSLVDGLLRLGDPSDCPSSALSRPKQIAALLRGAEQIAAFCLANTDPSATFSPLLAATIVPLGIDLKDVPRICNTVRSEAGFWRNRCEPVNAANSNVSEPVTKWQNLTSRDPNSAPLTIVVAEDNEAQRKLICHALRATGQTVLASADGNAALGLAVEHQADIVIADWQMPGMDGLELCSALRRAKVGQGVYFILVTGDGDEQVLVDAFEHGVDDFVAKPFRPRTIQARIKAARRLIHVETEVRDERTKLRRLAADLAAANRRLESASFTDFLTELPNRRFFMQQLDEHWYVAARKNQALSCLILDVDHFKSINDRYGHAVGDAVLKEIATVFQMCRRKDDVTCRYGGEEFAVLLPDSNADVARQVAERLRLAVETEITSRLPLLQQPVTVSVGLATRTSQNASTSELLEDADQALYHAKKQGRNRICVKPIAEDLHVVEHVADLIGVAAEVLRSH